MAGSKLDLAFVLLENETLSSSSDEEKDESPDGAEEQGTDDDDGDALIFDISLFLIIVCWRFGGLLFNVVG